MVVEVAVLIIALVIALIRVNHSPGLFPMRLLATVWVDVFRGVPTVLLVYLIGFGIPALELEGLPTDPVVLGGIALTLSYSGYVSEVYRAGINSVHRGQTDAALSVGLTHTQTMRHVILPQAIRRVAPPLLNDFVALQKDVALISIIGPQEAFRVAQIFQGENFNYTPIIAAALLYLVITVPLARVVDRMGGRGGTCADGGGGAPVIEVRGVTKAFGEREVLHGVDFDVAEHEAVALIGASGSGKSTLLRCIDLLEEIDDGDIFLDGEVITDPAVDAGRGAAQARRRLPGLQPLPPHERARRTWCWDRCGRRRQGGARPRRKGGRCSRASASRGARATGPTSSPAASSSGWRSPAPSPASPGRCCSTR